MAKEEKKDPKRKTLAELADEADDIETQDRLLANRKKACRKELADKGPEIHAMLLPFLPDEWKTFEFEADPGMHECVALLHPDGHAVQFIFRRETRKVEVDLDEEQTKKGMRSFKRLLKLRDVVASLLDKESPETIALTETLLWFDDMTYKRYYWRNVK